jgi:hypothetical protein
MLKFDTARIKPIERENFSHGVLVVILVSSPFFSFVIVIFFIGYLIYVRVRMRMYMCSDLPHFPRHILDRNRMRLPDIHALDRLKMLVSMSDMALCNFQKLYE